MPEFFTLTCPACSDRLRIRLKAEMPEKFKVRCPSCSDPFVVRRRGDEFVATDGSSTRTIDSGADSSSLSLSVAPLSPAAAQSVRSTGSPSSAGVDGRATMRLDEQATSAAAARSAARSSSVVTRRLGDTTFSPGERISERYQIIRFLSRGGMGEVYEAADLALKENVALKTVRPEIADDERAIERFKREIQLARQVTHRNVCRIHDLGTHRDHDGVEVLFVTMELLQGQTLADLLKVRPRLPPEEALPIIEQMAAGLDAAHAAGVVHRDFKSGNVMLVVGGGETRAVVTDFGLARRGDGDKRFVATMTVADGLLGSPAYMAPEQVEGRSVGPKSDIYAFGTVIYEMVTGELPYKAENPLATAVKRLTENPVPPREVNPALDDRWERTILRCLERSPEGRFPTATAAVAALLGREQEEVKPRRRKEHRGTLFRAAVAGFLVAAAIGVNWVVWRSRASDEAGAFGYLQPPEVARPAVALLGFTNVTGKSESAWMATALGEMLGSELGSGGGVRIVPGEIVARVQRELGLESGQTLSTETLRKLRSNLGSDYVLLGSYTTLAGPEAAPADERVRVDLRIQDTLSQDNATSVAQAGRVSELFDLVAQLGEDLRRALALEERTSGRQEATWKGVSAEATKLYSEGLEALRQFDAKSASESLKAAAEADPRNPRIRAALAGALSSLGYIERAREEAKLAFDLAGNLSDDERLSIKAQFLETAGEWVGAVNIYEQLWRRTPDDVEVGLRLAAALSAAGRGRDALQVCDILRRLPSAAARDPRISLAEAVAAGATGDFRRLREAAKKASQECTLQGAVILRARARLLEAWALRNLGEGDAARVAIEEARSAYQRAGDRAGSAYAQMQLGTLLYDQGDFAAARREHEAALAISREVGDKGNEAQALANIGVASRQLGELDRAVRLYDQALVLYRETGNRAGEGTTLNNMAAIRLQRGDLAEAERLFGESASISEALDNRSGWAYALYNQAVVLRKRGRLDEAQVLQEKALAMRREMGQRLAEVASLTDLAALAFDRGKLDDARRGFEEALVLAREVDNRRFEAQAMFGIGEIRGVAGLLSDSRRQHSDALAIRLELGEQYGSAESRLALARLDLEEARTADAQAAALQVVSDAGKLGATDLAMRAAATRAEALLFLGRLAEADTVVRSGLGRLREDSPLRVRHELAMVAARIDAAYERTSVARQRLESAVQRAREAGFLELRLEADLLLAQLRFDAADPASRRRLATVGSEAGAAGFDLIERKARLTLGG